MPLKQNSRDIFFRSFGCVNERGVKQIQKWFHKTHNKNCLQAVQDARQASALKVIKKREKDRQVKTLFFKIENSSFTCMGAQFWLQMSSLFTNIIEKWF